MCSCQHDLECDGRDPGCRVLDQKRWIDELRALLRRLWAHRFDPLDREALRVVIDTLRREQKLS